MTLPFPKAVQILHRPQLITPDAAEHFAARLLSLDDRAFDRRANPLSMLRRLSAAWAKRPAAPVAMEDDDDDDDRPREPVKPKAYAPMWMGQPDAEGETGWVLKSGVGVLNIDTPLVENGFGFCGTFFHGYDTIQAAVQEMDADDRVKGIFIRWESPGGVVAPGIYDLTSHLQARSRDAKEGAKQILSYCDQACSAAYWLPAQTDRLVAPSVGVVGSIGAVMTHVSYAGMYEKAGVTVTPIQFGAHKTDGADFKALSDEARANMQAVIDNLGEDFLAAVEAGRGAKLTADMARATQARVYLATHRDASHSGLAQGFVDAIGPQPQAFAEFAAEVASSPFKIRVAASASARQPAAGAANSQEKSMKLDVTNTSALAKAMAGDPALAAAVAATVAGYKPRAETPPANPDDEDEDAADAATEDDKPDAEGEDEDADAEGEEEDVKAAAPAARKPSARVALAIRDLPEAQGREAQARKLGETPGMTVESAREILATAPKASRLASRMTDVALTAGGGKKETDEDRMMAAAYQAAGVVPRRVG